MHACNFSYSHYAQTLHEIKGTHCFANFVNYSNHDLILRHDVDLSLESALEIAKIEKRLEIQSTFFILFHSEFYNLFNVTSSNIIKKILHMGHKLGLHYNTSFIIQNDLDPTETINNEIKLMEQHFNTRITAIAMHNPVINKKISMKLPNGIINADSDEFKINRKYLSDSVQNWREGCFCHHIRKHDSMLILIHPIWWTTDNKKWDEIMKSLINGYLDNRKKQLQSMLDAQKQYINKLNANKIRRK